MSPREIKVLLLTYLKPSFALSLNNERASVFPTRTGKSLLLPVRSLIVINIPGIRYKGLIPATFGTETAARFSTWSGIYLRQIAPERFLRNKKNQPDKYEADVLKALAEQASTSGESRPNWDVTDSGKTLRLVLPLYYSKACLDCHGEPKGVRDISGYPREGGKEGELGGAISVKLPIK